MHMKSHRTIIKDTRSKIVKVGYNVTLSEMDLWGTKDIIGTIWIT